MVFVSEVSNTSNCACRGFFKTYKEMGSSDQDTLLKFYTQTKDINFVEKAKVLSSESGSLKLQVTPVGETRLPVDEFELKVCICSMHLWRLPSQYII